MTRNVFTRFYLRLLLPVVFALAVVVAPLRATNFFTEIGSNPLTFGPPASFKIPDAGSGASTTKTCYMYFEAGTTTQFFVHLVATGPGAAGSDGYYAWVYRTSGNGGAYGTQIKDSTMNVVSYLGGSLVSSGHWKFPVTASAGEWFKIGLAVDDGANAFRTTGYFQFNGAAAPPQYWVTFAIPANSTGKAIYYVAMQPGPAVSQTAAVIVQPNGAAAYTWQVGSFVDTTTNVKLYQWTSGTMTGPPLNSFGVPDSTHWAAFSPTDLTALTYVGLYGIPTVGAANSGAGPASGTLGSPSDPASANPTTDGSAVGAPTGSPATSTSPTATPNPAPSGTGGATTADIQTQTNQLNTASNDSRAAATTNANGIITAVNNNAAANTTAANGVISAINKQNATNDQIRANSEAAAKSLGDIQKGLTNLGDGVFMRMDAAKDRLASIDTQIADGKTAALAYASAEQSGVNSKITTATTGATNAGTAFTSNSRVSGAVGLAGTNPILGDNGYALESHTVDTAGSVVMEQAFGGTVDQNFLTSEALARVIGTGTALKVTTWVRNLISWCTVVSFLVWTFGEVKQNLLAMVMASPMHISGSASIVAHIAPATVPVGVPAAGALWALQVIAISTLFLSSPVIIVAAIADIGTTPALVTTATAAATGATSSVGSFFTNSISYIYVILPVAVLVTAFVNQILVRVASITQMVITAVAVKVIGM